MKQVGSTSGGELKCVEESKGINKHLENRQLWQNDQSLQAETTDFFFLW